MILTLEHFLIWAPLFIKIYSGLCDGNHPVSSLGKSKHSAEYLGSPNVITLPYGYPPPALKDQSNWPQTSWTS